NLNLTDQGQLALEVKDNGQGISEHLIEKLGKEVVPSEKGTGSALENLNRRLINLYGPEAQLNIVSSPKGSSFSVIIPNQSLKEDQK
ncbi:ATP-binding protein, partial [Streptococcus pluranimalium]